MWSIFKKEINQFFSNLTGILAIVLFLLINGLFLFVLQDSSIFEFGYANLDKFFELAPWVLMFLVSAITMRLFADEFISKGTIIFKEDEFTIKITEEDYENYPPLKRKFIEGVK